MLVSKNVNDLVKYNKAKAKSKFKTNLIWSVSHDLRAPISSIVNSVQLLDINDKSLKSIIFTSSKML